MKPKIYTGILTHKNGKSFLVDSKGMRLFEHEKIWPGYVTHWLGRNVNSRHLPQKDYETGKNIIIMWPYEEPSKTPFVELYYNERLVKYPFSLLGHLAINVNGEIFNYSHLINENEIILKEEYLYRPALGEFAPNPVTGLFDVSDPGRPYYDKFGRNFMRTIHALHIEGVDTKRLAGYYKRRLAEIVTSPDPRRPEKYRDFSLFSRSCVTIIRDGLREYGFRDIRGIFPRDFFINAAYHLLQLHGTGALRVRLFKLPQLKVPEAPYSSLTFIMNPRNRPLAFKLPKY
jgi:hypothetical protein